MKAKQKDIHWVTAHINPMKIIFLDIDGVLNTSRTKELVCGGCLGIEPGKADLIKRIVKETGAKIVLTSTWRHHPDLSQAVRDQVVEFIGVTRSLGTERGFEIEEWLIAHPEVERYAIIDDTCDMLASQSPNFFQCYWDEGLIPELAERIIKHLNFQNAPWF